MKKADVIAHFGTNVDVAKALGVTKQAVGAWEEIIPEGMAYKVQVITGGALIVDPGVYQRLKKRRKAA